MFVLALSPLVVAYVVACFRDPLRWALPPYAVLIPFGPAFRVFPAAFGGASSLLGLLLGAALGASPWTVLLGTWPGRACAVAGVALALAARSWSGHLVRRAGGSGTARARVRP